MVLTPNFGKPYDDWFCREPPASDLPAGTTERWDWSTFRCFRTWTTRDPAELPGQRRTMGRRVPVPTYAIDDQSAVKVTDGAVEVVTEGHWKLFTP